MRSDDQKTTRIRSDEDISRVRIALRRINLHATCYSACLLMGACIGVRLLAGGFYRPLGVVFVAAAVVGLVMARRVVRALNETATFPHCFGNGVRPIGASMIAGTVTDAPADPRPASEARQ